MGAQQSVKGYGKVHTSEWTPTEGCYEGVSIHKCTKEKTAWRNTKVTIKFDRKKNAMALTGSGTSVWRQKQFPFKLKGFSDNDCGYLVKKIHPKGPTMEYRLHIDPVTGEISFNSKHSEGSLELL
eukprot:CAMPEP_0205824004 /NCGR_PEP_ID=MMETSP0206-20130828/18986_1 /ASSEMBLY_ACC=CAM_ASM_000279 /TAXON_ID=36767 /ORGANISM="Euplotes focardii, Strain TN1" /LENGTH=124 /DNA_ID=CAMNT_0053121717 /DNA_START=26 /DNA_END=400 /DNA_ORIENTATION=-